ncbi:MAG: cache domain-containing protein, partial [Methanobacteriota archaeon]
AIDAGAIEQNIIEVPLAKDAIQLIENGSADAWVYNELAGQHAIDLNAADPARFGVGKVLGMSTYYIAFHPETSTEFVNAVNTTLQELKRDRAKTGVTEYERILARYLPVQCAKQSLDRDQVMELVNLTASTIATDAQGTIASIDAGESPYRDVIDSELYVFVFDTKVNLLANAANPVNTGKNLAGTTDVFGYPFRDKMIEGAVQNGSGWVSYGYSNPDSLGLYQKMSYYQLVKGSDGKEYVVGAGRYLTCSEEAENLSV